jgi:hypothetical protein
MNRRSMLATATLGAMVLATTSLLARNAPAGAPSALSPWTTFECPQERGARSVAPSGTFGDAPVADLAGASADAVAREAFARGVEAMPLSLYFATPPTVNGLLFGFGAVRPEDSAEGMRRLAASIDAVRAMDRQRASR